MATTNGRSWLPALLAALIVAGCSAKGTPVRPPAELLPLESPQTLQRYWQIQSGVGSEERNLTLVPQIVGRQIVVTDRQGLVSGIAAATGAMEWQVATGEQVAVGAGAATEQLYLGSVSGELIVFERDSGAELWRRQLSSEVLSTPLISAGQIVVRTGDGQLHALDAQSGERRWGYQASVPVLSLRGVAAPQLMTNTLYAGFANGRLAALDFDSGKLLWQKVVAIPKGRSELERMVDLDATPIAHDGALFVVTYQGRLVSLLPESGAQVWERELSSHLAPLLVGNVIYLVDADDQLWAIDSRSGASLWRQAALQYRRLTAPVVVGKMLVVGDFEGYLHWLDLASGRLVARQQIFDDQTIIGLSALDDRVVAYSSEGQLAAWGVVLPN